jgi:RNA polymerase sigma-54 factor
MADLKRICGVDDEDLADMVAELRAYDPKPGSRFSDRRHRAGQPRRFRPPHPLGLRGRAQYRRAASAARQPPLLSGAEVGAAGQGSKAWLSECLASANWLVRALDQRARTIVKVVSEIVKTQAASSSGAPRRSSR